jgi:hypothetical protein
MALITENEVINLKDLTFGVWGLESELWMTRSSETLKQRNQLEL